MRTTGPSTRGAGGTASERDFLIRSIADLDREHAAGDVDDADYAALRADYVRRAADALRASAREQSAGDVDGVAHGAHRFRRYLGRRRTRLVLGGLGVACLLGAATLAAAAVAGVRLPGESASGSVSVPTGAQVRAELADAARLGSAGNLGEAVTLYDSVLAEVPDQPEALTYKGWLERLAGIAGKTPKIVEAGDESIALAVAVAPRYPDARAFYGIALIEDRHEAAPALAQFRAFLADDPSTGLLDALGPRLVATFEAAHEAVPSALVRFEKPSAPRAARS